MDTLREFWADWGPWIMVSLIPTIISGLSVSPRTEGAAAWFKKAMGFLSAATFKDVPGTFKIPLTPAKTTKDVTPMDQPNDTSGDSGISRGTTLLVLVLLAVSPLFTGCAWFGSSTEKTKQIMIDCTTQAVASKAPHLLPIVTSIVKSEGLDWKRLLEALAKELSQDVVACTLQQVAIDLQAQVPASGPEGSPETKKTLEGMQRARTYIDERNWQFKE